MFHLTPCSLPALSYKDSTFSPCFYPSEARITAPVGFSSIFTNMLLLPFLMNCNWAASQNSCLTFFPHQSRGCLALLSSSVWWSWEASVRTGGSSPFVDDLLICTAYLGPLVYPQRSWLCSSLCQNWQLSVGFFWSMMSGAHWHSGLTVGPISLFSSSELCPCLGSVSAGLHILFPLVAFIPLSFLLLWIFFHGVCPSRVTNSVLRSMDGRPSCS